MKKILLWFGCIVCFTACNEKGKEARQETPHIAMPQMQNILTDLHQAEVYSSMLPDTNHKGGMKNIDSLAVFYKDIFKHHNISLQQFQQSLQWYKEHPSDLDTMYKHMIIDLSLMEGGSAPEGK